jgi:hypothetical protein
LGHGEAGFAIAREIGRVAALLQRFLQELRGFAVVLDHQHAHRSQSPSGSLGFDRRSPDIG